MTFDRISAHLAQAICTLDYSLTCLHGDPDAIADIEDVIAGLRELRLEIEVRAHPPPPACRHRPPHREAGTMHAGVEWTHRIVERDPNPLAIPPRPSPKPEAVIHFDLRLVLNEALPAALEIAGPVQIARRPQPALTRTVGPKSLDDTCIESCGR